jgi:hypothetical protein
MGRAGANGDAARTRCQHSVIAAAHRDVDSIRSRICRAPRGMRAATDTSAFSKLVAAEPIAVIASL